MPRILIIAGIALIALGLIWLLLDKLGIAQHIGRLPGDIVIRRENFSFYFPIVTCLIVSVVGSLIFWLLRR